jgi:hypothetical protein
MAAGRILGFTARRLVIIDSVPEGQLESGRMLLNRINEWGETKVKLLCEYEKVNTVLDLKTKLERLAATIPTDGIPILHLAMHGDEDGLQLASGECIDWDDLSPFLLNLNIATKNNLLVTLATCYGLHTANVNAANFNRSAYWCVMGRQDTHSGGDFTNDYSKFYRTLLESSNFGDAIKAINLPGMKDYQIYSGLGLFKNAAQLAIDGYITNGEERQLLAKAKKKFRTRNQPISHKHLRRLVRDKFIDSLIEWRKKFFLIDYFPENEDRFLTEVQLRLMITKAIRETEKSQKR